MTAYIEIGTACLVFSEVRRLEDGGIPQNRHLL